MDPMKMSNGAELFVSTCARANEVCKKYCGTSPHHSGANLMGLFQSVGMLGIGRWTTFPRGHRKRERGRQGKEGLGRKWERKRERERAGRRGNERILFFLYLSFPCYLPYDFLIHQNAGKIMFWAK